ncbi:hypothetical protein BXY82_0432 [Gelidibacter sediminis]|uniref:Uncharacterized protein n=1 Tax=Gelidibacter sediminis TaxID=1608710 RepID=A0A4R7Q629_9FLAO|nr:hypothetical protein BXY82_0432 [Gelidibacter sediminis]
MTSTKWLRLYYVIITTIVSQALFLKDILLYLEKNGSNRDAIK